MNNTFNNLISAGSGVINYGLSKSLMNEQYKLNEKAAAQAQARAYNMYNNLYSPKAQMQQITAAGLSPSIYASGGIAGKSGASGAQGNASAVSGNMFNFDPTLSAQNRLIESQINKTNAETSAIKQETIFQEMTNKLQKLVNQTQEYEIMFNGLSLIDNENGQSFSLYDIAENCNDFKEFKATLKTKQFPNSELKQYIDTAYGERVIRNIYYNTQSYKADIKNIALTDANAGFEMQIVKALENTDFAKLNADAAIQYLKTNISAGELTETQKSAWNNLLNKLGEDGSTTKDIIIVLGMLLNNAMMNYKLPK